MQTLDQAWSAGETPTIEDMAAEMKAKAQAKVAAVQTKPKPAPKTVEPTPEAPTVKVKRKPAVRVARVATESGAVVAIRREIVVHEREIKRLAKALKALGAA